MAAVAEGTLLWQPTPQFQQESTLAHYMSWLAETRGHSFDSYTTLWEWSVRDLEGFWSSLWDYFAIQCSTPYTYVLSSRQMPGAAWFEGARLNYAEHMFRQMRGDEPALISQSETRPLATTTWQELYDQVAAMAAVLRDLGVGVGDRVVAYMPNIPETLIAFLATASLGAIWSSCSPDFGSRSVIDRFAQIGPKVLFAVDGYSYNGTIFDRLDRVSQLLDAMPTVEHTIVLPYASSQPNLGGIRAARLWDDVLAPYAARKLTIEFAQVPFAHPLWVLYSSGTTGLPKAIVQGHGGILLEHLRNLALQSNVQAGDRFFWFTTTGWMMWNLTISALLLGATVLLYDGSVAYPDLDVLWQFAEGSRMTLFGTSAGYLTTCMSAGLRPRDRHDLSAIVSVSSTGSPLSPEGFQWVYDAVKADTWLVSASGGTDVCTAFVGGSPLLPVRAGELQCRGLGIDVEAFDEYGRPLIGEVGELVITTPMPSMPLFFWNDPDGRRYHESYFAMYPGVWRHGDWIKITPEGGCVIYGRSDSTINRLGVRMGTSEIYRVVEDLPEVRDSLVIDLEVLGRRSYMPLFIVLAPDATFDEQLQAKIKQKIRNDVSPRHVPDAILAIEEVPRTLNGKKLEVPIRKILLGMPVDRAVSVDSMSNPGSLAFFVAFAERLNTEATASGL